MYSADRVVPGRTICHALLQYVAQLILKYAVRIFNIRD